MQLKNAGYDSGPTSLVTGSDARAIVSMKVFVEKQIVLPVGIVLKFRNASKDGPAPGSIPQEDLAQPRSNFAADLKQIHEFPGAGGTLDGEVVSVVAVQLQQR